MPFDPSQYGAKKATPGAVLTSNSVGGKPTLPKIDVPFRASPNDSILETGFKSAGNFPKSLYNIGRGLVDVGVKTTKGVAGEVAGGRAMEGIINQPKGGSLARGGAPEEGESQADVTPLIEYFSSRYGTMENFQKTATEDPAGVGLDILGILTGGGALVGRLGTVASGISKVGKVGTVPVKGVAKMAGDASKQLLSTATGNVGKETISRAVQGSPEFTEAMRRGTPDIEIANQTRDGLGQVRQQRSDAYQEQLKKVIGDNPKSFDISPIAKETTKQMNRFNVKINPSTGAIDVSRSSLVNDAPKIEAIMSTINEWGMKTGDRTVVGIDKLKQQLRQFREPSNPQLNSFVDGIVKATQGIIKDTPGYAKLEEDYTRYSGFLDEIERTLSLKDSATADNTISKLNTALKDNKEYRTQLLGELDEMTGKNFSDMIAGKSMSEWLPGKGLAKYIAPAVGTSAAFGGIPLSTVIPALALSSPRLVGEFLRVVGITGRSVKKVFDMINKLPEGSVNPLIRDYINEYTQNPKLGLAIDDVSKGIPKDLQPLAAEARKYKSAVENMEGHALDSLPKNTETIKINSSLIGKDIGLDIRDLQKQTTGKLTSNYWLKKIQKGERPPILIDSVGGALRVVDGNHRATAYKELGVEDVPIILTKKAQSQLTDFYNKVVGKKEVDAFKNFTDLTTKLLGKLEGRSTVSRQFIEDLTNSPDLKQAERDLFRSLLKDEPATVNVKTFANKVKSELLPLKEFKKIGAGSGKEYPITSHEFVTLPQELRGPVANYKERIYESPIKTSAGDTHYSGLGADNYFAHSRIEDLPDVQLSESGRKGKLTGEDTYNLAKAEQKKGSTRRVIEIQSDLFQKGRLEKEIADREWKYEEGVEKMTSPQAQKELDAIDARKAELSKLEPYRNTWQERIIREEVKQAAKDDKTKLQFPTGETAMKIEGLGERAGWQIRTPERTVSLADWKAYMKTGQEVFQEGSDESWIITDVLGDGKFKAIEKRHYDDLDQRAKDIIADGRHPVGHNESLEESFDISGKVDTNNPIYKFYNKEVRKYLVNKYGAREVVDPQGVTWVEVDVKKDMAKLPIEAFGVAPLMDEEE